MFFFHCDSSLMVSNTVDVVLDVILSFFLAYSFVYVTVRPSFFSIFLVRYKKKCLFLKERYFLSSFSGQYWNIALLFLYFAQNSCALFFIILFRLSWVLQQSTTNANSSNSGSLFRFNIFHIFFCTNLLIRVISDDKFHSH